MKKLQSVASLSFMLFFLQTYAEDSLPDELRVYMDSLSVSYEPIGRSQLSEDAFWWNKDAAVQIDADFDGDDQKDYALLVNTRKTYVSVIVFLNRGKGFSHRVIYEKNYGSYFDKNDVQVFILPAEGIFEGLYEDFELKNTGIQIMETVGNRNAVYFWENGEFERVPIDD